MNAEQGPRFPGADCLNFQTFFSREALSLSAGERFHFGPFIASLAPSNSHHILGHSFQILSSTRTNKSISPKTPKNFLRIPIGQIANCAKVIGNLPRANSVNSGWGHWQSKRLNQFMALIQRRNHGIPE
jgi:hypothetical protein